MKKILVGGAVRDMLLGRPINDCDFLLTGIDREELLRQFPAAREVGRDMPSYIIDGCEHALPRAETLERDLARRDLTINALALEDSGRLHAHPRALNDLREGILRPASPDSIAEDPLRVFRAARFAAELPDFSASPELLAAMREACRQGLTRDLPAERLAKETLKALAAPRPSRFLELLHLTGCLEPWFRELSEADEIPAGPPQFHKRSLLGHTMRVMDAVAGEDPVPEDSDTDTPQTLRALAVWMALCHDLGKTATRRDKWPSHYGHDVLGEPLAEDLGRRLGLPNRFIDAGKIAAALHMTAGSYPKLRPGTRVDLLTRLHARKALGPLFALVRADHWLRDHDEDSLPKARADLKIMLGVHLPEADRNLGAASGARLRELRAMALANSRRQA